MPKATGMQRDKIVSSRALRALVTRMKVTGPSGSSSVFKRLFCAASFMRSASSMSTVRRFASTG